MSVPNSAKKKKTESSRSKPGSERLPMKENEFSLNLTVCGSSAPLCFQQEKSTKERKIPKLRKKKEIKKFKSSLPLDKIILLAEKLNIKEEDHRELSSFLSQQEKQAEKNGFFEEVQKPSDDFGQDFSFYLDISSLSNTNDESEESCSDLESKDQKKVESSNGLDENPFVTSHPYAENPQPKNILSKRFDSQRSLVVPSMADNGFSSSRESSSHKSRSSSRRTCGSDLICLYVNSVNTENDFQKFFRPCKSCQKVCCVCESTSRSEKKKKEEDAKLWDPSAKEHKSVETDDNLTLFADSVSLPFEHVLGSQKTPQELFSSRSCPEPSASALHPLGNDQGDCYYCRDCCCQEVEECGSFSDRRILPYVFSLANAARSARSLARDLESVLSTFKSGIGLD